MRLLHTSSLQYRDFYDPHTPSYCILSHRWGHDEVDFVHMRTGTYSVQSRGFQKIRGSCARAASLGYSWIWIDTCNIDKANLTELTEAINSMYRWYARAEFCIALLDDVSTPKAILPRSIDDSRHPRSSSHTSRLAEFRQSEWFNRGWTLQELLAPRQLAFYDREFGLIGSKHEMSELVSEITGIRPLYLNGKRHIYDASVAERLSWASRRRTTRPEDMAHSLFGILGIPSMPLLYGDGAKAAFHRLQLELLKVSSDESIFAWLPHGIDCSADQPYGMLAESPRDFASSGCIESIGSSGLVPYTYTNRGLQLDRPYVSVRDERPKEFWQGSAIDPTRVILKLACRKVSTRRNSSPGSDSAEVLAVTLREFDGSWYRVRCTTFHTVPARLGEEPSQTFYLPQIESLRRRSVPGDISSWTPYGVSQDGESYYRSRRKRARTNFHLGALIGVISEFLV